MAYAQKPDFVFRRNGRVHLNRRGRQFSRLLAAEVCASGGSNAGYTLFRGSEGYWLPTPFAIFPFTSPPVRHRVPSGFKRTLPQCGTSVMSNRYGAWNLELAPRFTENLCIRVCM